MADILQTIIKRILLNESRCIFIQISLKFVPHGRSWGKDK